jgi:hypothetical protein
VDVDFIAVWRGSLNNRRSSEARLVQHTVMLFPVGPIDHGTANQHSSLGEVQVSYNSLLAQQRGNGNGMGERG